MATTTKRVEIKGKSGTRYSIPTILQTRAIEELPRHDMFCRSRISDRRFESLRRPGPLAPVGRFGNPFLGIRLRKSRPGKLRQAGLRREVYGKTASSCHPISDTPAPFRKGLGTLKTSCPQTLASPPCGPILWDRPDVEGS